MSSTIADKAWARGPEVPQLLEQSVGDLLRAAVARGADTIALVEGSPDAATRRRWTYGEMLAAAEVCAAALLARFPVGSHIGIWSPNIPEYQLLQYGAALAGMVIVTINPAFRRAELVYALDLADVVGLFTVKEFRGRDMLGLARELAAESDTLSLVVDLEDWDEFLAAGDRAVALPVVDPSSPAQILFTSGTTGNPKAALLSHRGMVNNVAHDAAIIAGTAADRAVWLATLPMFHLAGCVVAATGSLALHGALVTVRNFDAALAIQLIEEERVSLTNIVPTLMWAIIRHPDFAAKDTSSFHSVMLGGAPIPPELVRQVEALGIVPIVGYGLTEAAMTTTTRAEDSWQDQVNTCGLPLPHIEVLIADPETGEPRAADEVGEILTRGFHTLIGYYKNPEATAAAIDADGWFHTGDLGTMDERGYLSMAGRAKDMIIRGGENVYPREIEDHLVQLEGIANAAVIGLPDDYYGEVVAAFIQVSPGHVLDPAAHSTVLREELTGYKVPSRWFVVGEFPLTPSGKIQKFALKEQWEAGAYPEVARG
ncbi:AMP-binding protein [soil metagenome]